MAGNKGAPAYIVNTLGLENIVKDDAEWPNVAWENVVRANPTYIVAGEMKRRRFPLDDIQVKLDFLQTDPVIKMMSAVQENNIIKMEAHLMNPTMRSVEGLEVIANVIAEKQGQGK